jgi:phage gpG-like protein
VPLTGDFGKLRALVGQLADLGEGLPPELPRAMADEALSLVQMGFRTSSDPYGVPWAPPKGRAGQPLRDTGRLAGSFTSKVTSDGFSVGSNVAYAPYHQGGTGRMAARKMVPDEALPASWEASLAEAGEEALVARYPRLFKP